MFSSLIEINENENWRKDFLKKILVKMWFPNCIGCRFFYTKYCLSQRRFLWYQWAEDDCAESKELAVFKR